jgi:uncharacterized protein (DUF427 family)
VQRSARSAQLTVYPTMRRIRGVLDGVPLVDSQRGLLMWEPDAVLPLYAFPREDVDLARLEPAPPPADAHARPAASWFRLRSGRDSKPVAWAYGGVELDDQLAFAWRAVDHWYEEDEEVFGHPRDPFHRVDAIPSSRHVRIEVDGRLIAESARPVLVFETGLPVRYYLPPTDFDGDVLRPSDTHTLCPYKGVAAYHDIVIGDRVHTDLVWHYPQPLAAMTAIAGMLAPYSERADLTVEGQRLERTSER